MDESSIIAITDKKGVIKKVNNNFCLISKYNEQELIGQDHHIVNSGYHPKEFMRNLWLTIDNGKIWRGELKNKAKDGTCYWVDTTIVPFLNENGKPYQYLAIRADITARKETEEYLIQRTAQLETANKELVSKYQLQNIFLNAPANICILEGRERKYILANKAYEKLTNRKATDLLGQNLHEVFPELTGTGTFELFDTVFKTGEPFNDPEYATMVDLNNDGVLQQCYFNFSMDPLKNDSGEIYAVMALSYNITAQVEARKIIDENEKQQAFLLKLSDALRPLSNSVDIEEAVTKTAMDFMGADWCHYATIEEDNFIIQRSASRDDFPSLAGVYPTSSFALFKAALNTGIPSIIDDVHTSDIIDEDLKQLCVQLQNIAFVIVPVIKNGKPVGLLSLVQSKPRKWTDSEVQLTIETAERTWSAIERAIAEEALSISEEKYRILFTSIDQGFALCELVRNKEGKGIDYCMLEVNSAYEKQSGLSMEIMLGKTMLQAFPTLDKWWIETYAAVVDDQRPAIFEKYFEVTHRWFGVNAYPVSKERFAVLFSDITERKQAEEKLKENDIIFKSIPDALISSDLIGRITSWNEGAEALYGFSKEEMIGQIMPDVVPTEFLNKKQENWQEIFARQGHWKGEVIHTCKDGKKIYVSSVAHIIHNTRGENSGYVAINRDITSQKEADIKLKESEKQLRELSTELEQKVQQRTAQLVEKNTELVNMNKELEAFTYVSSHDLQEPLRKIQVFIGRIIDNEGQNFTEKGIDYFHRIRASANRMQTLIKDLLSFSRLNTAERKFEITDLNIVIDEVKAELRDTIQEKHASIENTELGSCNIIAFQFRQLMYNLISNALKFSNPDIPSHIIIKSRVEKGNNLNNEKPALSPGKLLPEKNYCHITVKDNGIGFEPHFSERIFEVFQKLHSKEVYAGTGIGLAIVKKIVENHNGIITATGELNKGATFDIYIPST